jgi:hypothetical protein
LTRPEGGAEFVDEVMEVGWEDAYEFYSGFEQAIVAACFFAPERFAEDEKMKWADRDCNVELNEDGRFDFVLGIDANSGFGEILGIGNMVFDGGCVGLFDDCIGDLEFAEIALMAASVLVRLRER